MRSNMSKNLRDYLLYLEDIINAIEKIENYTQNMDFDKFSKNEMVIDAVIRNKIPKSRMERNNRF